MLAINGGSPVWTGGWPSWPIPNEEARSGLIEVLESGRWAISGLSIGKPSKEQLFSRTFADYCGVGYCVPTTSGSSALLIALEALNIGRGDEVIVPALTWVATASAVTNVNAMPVLVDIDPNTLCLSPEAVRAAITPRTAAIIPVHLYAGMADMDEILAIASQKNVAVIEDCSHAHGARWKGAPAGSLGDIGTFSMQQTKLLTCGEGGATVTKDATLARKLEQLRSDGRVYMDGQAEPGKMDLIECGEIQGNNYALSEFQAAILLVNLKLLDLQHKQRSENAALLDTLFSEISGVIPLSCDHRVDKRVFYCYIARIDPDAFAGRTSKALSCALSLELGFQVAPMDPPVHRSRLYNPLSKKRFAIDEEYLRRLDITEMHFPHTEVAYDTCIAIHHAALLGGREHMHAIAEAFVKLKEFADSIPVTL